MNELSQKEELGDTFSKLQNQYYQDINSKFNDFTTKVDEMINDGTTEINGIMMNLGIGLA